jgi:hypothetical protein
LLATLHRPAVMGRLDSPLQPGPLGIFDRGNAVEVTLLGGALAGLPDVEVFAGRNAAAIRTAGGEWEVLQFAQAELIGSRRYRLRRLLRGQAGTEQVMLAGALTGADFLVLDGAVTPLPVRPDQLGLPLRYRFGPARDDHAAPSFSELTVAAEGLGLRPFAPVHLKARRDPLSGEVRMSWIRRARYGGDSWEMAEAPLCEEVERYLVEVLDGAALKRSFEVTSPIAAYGAAEQTSDWSAPPAMFEWRVRQWSQAVGWGAAGKQVSGL